MFILTMRCSWKLKDSRDQWRHSLKQRYCVEGYESFLFLFHLISKEKIVIILKGVAP